MSLTLDTLAGLMRLTLRSPRRGAAAVLAMKLPTPARWVAFWLMVVGSALGVHLSFVLQPAELQEVVGHLMSSPFRTALMQGMVMLVSVIAMAQVGRWFGGRGRFDDALILAAWLQAILLALQVVQLVALLILPPLADLLGLVALFLMFWLLTEFVAELHGFRSAVLVFIGILVTAVVLLFGVAFVLALTMGPLPGGM